MTAQVIRLLSSLMIKKQSKLDIIKIHFLFSVEHVDITSFDARKIIDSRKNVIYVT